MDGIADCWINPICSASDSSRPRLPGGLVIESRRARMCRSSPGFAMGSIEIEFIDISVSLIDVPKKLIDSRVGHNRGRAGTAADLFQSACHAGGKLMPRLAARSGDAAPVGQLPCGQVRIAGLDFAPCQAVPIAMADLAKIVED